MRIGLLNNLRAGASGERVSRILSFLKAHPDVVTVETDSAHAGPEALLELARHEVELLVINGGDGTVQHALTEILEHGGFDGRVPMVAPLRGGRTNMTGLDIGSQRDPVKGMAGLLEAVREGRVDERIAPRRVLRVQYGPGRNALCGMFFGGGMIYKAIEAAHRIFRDPRANGVLGASVVTGSLIARAAWGDHKGILEPNKVQMLLDGESMPDGEFSMVISATLHRLFARMRPFWATGAGAVRLTALSVNPNRLAAAVPGILRGKPRAFVTPENGYLSRNAKCVEMRLDCGFTVDGELVPGEPGRVVKLTADDCVQFVRA